ncbi:hypothetical protein NW767_015452 [Fusarium falciforme]|uniref:DUF7703 domain-containing protein n=1 Tax=Fusarium falciforme TaxID=195108 RepID=A0A9W8UU25_9HYPO|nr:hypothetical protein NW755_014688 [Fusarium falciforme]KAJ4176420.1 hypothetical protein NW767_015452 [Fusarium falciforme]KAJ4185656.1 hypothetical protein NW759_016969 [Fusarium solani]KAJ4222256.1 hypothetical protein NW757_014418 [Fusarium falciforme]
MAEIDLNTKNGVVAVVICVFLSIAYYNVLELNVHILTSFKKRRGLYFWSFVIATWGIAFNATGFLFRHLGVVAQPHVYSTLILIGWCTMITGQSVVLYSRLHIVMHNQKRLRLVLYMIITSAIWLHLPIIVLVYGSNSGNSGPFVKPYEIFEKIQLSVFFVQEVIISGLYVWETTKRLNLEKSIGNTRTRAVMNHLIYVDVVVILLDVTILALEFANLYSIQTAWKPLVYSIKLKLEFSILNRLVDLTRGGRHGSSYTRSQGAHDVALETFNGERSRHVTGTDGQAAPEYEVRVGKGDQSHGGTHGPDSYMKTTEITVHTHRRRSNSDRYSDSIREVLLE